MQIKYYHQRRVQRAPLPINGLKLWGFDDMVSEFRAHFQCAEIALTLLPV